MGNRTAETLPPVAVGKMRADVILRAARYEVVFV
jgi:hypothetical protein